MHQTGGPGPDSGPNRAHWLEPVIAPGPGLPVFTSWTPVRRDGVILHREVEELTSVGNRFIIGDAKA